MMNEELIIYQQEQERKEYLEHQNVLLAIGALFKSKEGLQLFKYLFKSFEVGTLPERGMDGETLHEYLGFLRAGNSIYKLACEADPEVAASLLAKIEKEKYDDLREQYRIENGLNRSSNRD